MNEPKSYTHTKKAASAITLLAMSILSTACDPPPDPVNLVVFLDSSESFAPRRQAAIDLVKDLNSQLEQDDQLYLFRIAGEVDWLYSDVKPTGKKLQEVLGKYVQTQPYDRGTAYGAAFMRGLAETQALAAKDRRTALVILGDGEDEVTARDANIDWKSVPSQYSKFPTNARLFFLFLQPHTGDRFRDAFKPVLGDRFEPFLTEPSIDGTARQKIIQFLRP